MLIAALLATLVAGLFAGAAVYITFVEHPARVTCGSVLAVTEFGPSYKRGAVMQAALALVGAGAGIARWGTGGGLGWLVGGGCPTGSLRSALGISGAIESCTLIFRACEG